MLKRMFPVLMAVVTAAAIVIACGEKEDKKETPANAAGVEAAGKLSLDKPSVLFTKAGEAMVSANMTGQGGTGLRPLNVVSASDDRCSRSGHPWDKDANSKMQVEADGYIPKLFYCLLNSKVDDSVETLPGFFKMQSSLICTFEKRLGIKTSDFTETGHEYINDSNKTLTFPPNAGPKAHRTMKRVLR